MEKRAGLEGRRTWPPFRPSSAGAVKQPCLFGVHTALRTLIEVFSTWRGQNQGFPVGVLAAVSHMGANS